MSSFKFARLRGFFVVSISLLGLAVPFDSATGEMASMTSENSCVKEALSSPIILEASMRHPGDHYYQTALVEFRFRKLAATCQARFAVARPRYQFQLQDHLHRSRWIVLNPFRTAGFSQRRNGRPFAAHWGIRRGHGLLKPISRRRLYQCSPGKAITKVRLLLKETVRSRETHRTVAKKTVIVPVKVLRVRARLQHRGALRGPC